MSVFIARILRSSTLYTNRLLVIPTPDSNVPLEQLSRGMIVRALCDITGEPRDGSAELAADPSGSTLLAKRPWNQTIPAISVDDLLVIVEP